MNKKAVELNVNTIIIVILAILVLVILALYFTGGIQQLWQKIIPIPGAYSQTDIEQTRNACTLYCSAGDKTSFCTHEFTIREMSDGEVIGTLPVYCDNNLIKALDEEECLGAGFTSDMCETIRSK
ncbi:MAG: hypothetical protein IB618_03465 [Candidatus Pacearchaeota archaeon]|nr:MAG: hypothetical protein IB618_03465 [Candidatus Pacearchaeota archaeon]